MRATAAVNHADSFLRKRSGIPVMPYRLISKWSERGGDVFKEAVDLFLSKMPEECGLEANDYLEFLRPFEDDGRYYFVLGEEADRILIVDAGEGSVHDVAEYLARSTHENLKELAEGRFRDWVASRLEDFFGVKCSTIEECEGALLKEARRRGIIASSTEEAYEALKREARAADDQVMRLERLERAIEYLREAKLAKGHYERERALSRAGSELRAECSTVEACERELLAAAEREGLRARTLEELEGMLREKLESLEREARELREFDKLLWAARSVRNAKLGVTCSEAAARAAEEFAAARAAGRPALGGASTAPRPRILLVPSLY